MPLCVLASSWEKTGIYPIKNWLQYCLKVLQPVLFLLHFVLRTTAGLRGAISSGEPDSSSMMEQPNPSKCHRHAVLVARRNHICITDGSARLCDVGYTGLVCPLNVVAEREERI